MNVVDVIIIALLILGGVAGFKAGVIKKLTDFIGMFVIVILSFTSKITFFISVESKTLQAKV